MISDCHSISVKLTTIAVSLYSFHFIYNSSFSNLISNQALWSIITLYKCWFSGNGLESAPQMWPGRVRRCLSSGCSGGWGLFGITASSNRVKFIWSPKSRTLFASERFTMWTVVSSPSVLRHSEQVRRNLKKIFFEKNEEIKKFVVF